MVLTKGFSPFSDFFRIYNSQLHCQHVEIPSAYNRFYPKPLPQTAVLRKPEGTFWNVKWTMSREDIISFGDGWSKFAKDNGLIDGDFVLFTYDGLRGFMVRIYRNGLLLKATDPITIHEISDDTDETDDNDDHHNEEVSSKNKILYLPWRNSHDGAICEVNNAPGSSKKDESTGDNDDHHLEEDIPENEIIYLPWKNSHDGAICEVNNAQGSSKTEILDDVDESNGENKIIYLPWRNSHDGAICEVNNARGSSETVEAVKNDRAAIAEPTAYLDDPKNPFFFPTCLTDHLVISMQIIKDYGLRFGRTINLIDGFGEVEKNVGEWEDCVVIHEWGEMYNRNNAKSKDEVICEVIRENDIVRSIKIHFVKK